MIAAANAAAACLIDSERLWADLMALGAITEADRPYTRRAFSPLFAEGRAFLRKRLEDAGLAVHVDAAGNLVGRLEGSEPALGAIVIGSHSDTVPGGGRFDGVAGVIVGVEVARVLASDGRRLRHPLEIVDFLAEEPSDFGLSCIGSRGLSGALTPAMLAMPDRSGQTLGPAIAGVGGDPATACAARRADIAACFELHIEQGPVLEREGIDVGVVTAIVGIRRLEIVFAGEAAHAGTSPMHVRRDAAFAGALAVVAVRERAEALAALDDGYFVATVGIVEILPGGSNVVARHCRIVVDVRSSDARLTERFVDQIRADSSLIAARARVDLSGVAVLSDGLPATCDAALRGHLRHAAQMLGYSFMDIASGAGHDAAFMARICPSAMLFIPCRGGMSHTPDEWADAQAMTAGAEVVLRAVQTFDRSV